jgi:hypothetical protein
MKFHENNRFVVSLDVACSWIGRGERGEGLQVDKKELCINVCVWACPVLVYKQCTSFTCFTKGEVGTNFADNCSVGIVRLRNKATE